MIQFSGWWNLEHQNICWFKLLDQNDIIYCLEKTDHHNYTPYIQNNIDYVAKIFLNWIKQIKQVNKILLCTFFGGANSSALYISLYHSFNLHKYISLAETGRAAAGASPLPWVPILSFFSYKFFGKHWESAPLTMRWGNPGSATAICLG